MSKLPVNYPKAIGLIRKEAIIQTDDSLPVTDYKSIKAYFGDSDKLGMPTKKELEAAWENYTDPDEDMVYRNPDQIIADLTERLLLVEQEIAQLKGG